jgi:hypothetical protein
MYNISQWGSGTLLSVQLVLSAVQAGLSFIIFNNAGGGVVDSSQMSETLLVSWAGIFIQPIGARNRVRIGLSYRPTRIHTTQPGGICSLESILGVLKNLKIRALEACQAKGFVCSLLSSLEKQTIHLANYPTIHLANYPTQLTLTDIDGSPSLTPTPQQPILFFWKRKFSHRFLISSHPDVRLHEKKNRKEDHIFAIFWIKDPDPVCKLITHPAGSGSKIPPLWPFCQIGCKSFICLLFYINNELFSEIVSSFWQKLRILIQAAN